jgi:hypothetical protein
MGELPDGDGLAPSTLRRLACDAGLIEVHVDGQGQPLSVGRKTRTIPAAIKRALLVRDRTCRYPGCSNRLFLDGHHVRHWADGGETSLTNLVLVCSFHHRRLHEQGGQLVLDEDGQPRFLDPSGRPVMAAPPRPIPSEVGWSSIRAANASLALDAETGACRWDGEDVDYGYATSMLLSAERRAREAVSEGAPERSSPGPS